MTPPSLPAFMALPDADLVAVAPRTVAYASSGTRRRAALEGVDLKTDTYMEWTRPQYLNTLALFFRFGAQHVIVPTLGPRQLSESGVYRDRLIEWTVDFMASPVMIEEYNRRGWRVRFMHTPASIPALVTAAQILESHTPHASDHTVWCYMVTDAEHPWRDLLAAANAGAQSYHELVRAIYGELIPPVDVLVGGGQLVLRTGGYAPPLLMHEDVHMYWTQRAGFSLTEEMVRRIWYDYAYGRRTFQADRSARYQHVDRYRALWDNPAVMGVGVQHDGFWYPESVPGFDAFDLDSEQDNSV